MRILQLFKRTEERREQESEEREAYVKYILEYTELNGVRETARRLEEAGFKMSHAILSEIRNEKGNYTLDYIANLANAISQLKSEKKS